MRADPDSFVKKSRPRRSKSEVLMLLEDYKNSGLTQVAFAKSRELPLSTFTNWLRRMGTNSSPRMGNSSRCDFLEAQIVKPPIEESEALSHDLELILGDQEDQTSIVKSVRLRSGFDSGDLIRVLDVLGGGGACNQGKARW